MMSTMRVQARSPHSRSVRVRPGRLRRQNISACASAAPGAPAAVVPPGIYCPSASRTERRKTRTVWVGKVPLGSEHPIARQTMATTDTKDVEASIAQVKRCVDAGADIVRLTVQGKKEADACMAIREGLWKDGYDVPLVADIHFAPKIAMKVAEAWEKIRVNPGNFADGMKKFESYTYETPEQYQEELDHIEEIFTPLVLKCKELNRCIRIGTNHGSLSARTLSYYGDTPKGMVESAFEFARICRKHDFHNFVFSMKASNPLVMVQAYRLLAAEMYKLGWDYPLHLGVTEAGEGEDGRMKSAIGIGALLLDGLGDTVRVSLTEDPEFEILPCNKLVGFGSEKLGQGIDNFQETSRDFTSFERRVGVLPEQKEGDSLDFRGILHRDGSVFGAVTLDQLKRPEVLYSDLGCKQVVGMPFKDIATCDSIFMRNIPTSVEEKRVLRRLQEVAVHIIAPAEELNRHPLEGSVAVFSLDHLASCNGQITLPPGSERYIISATGEEEEEKYSFLGKTDAVCLLLDTTTSSRLHASRRVFELLHHSSSSLPVIHHMRFDENFSGDTDTLIISAGAQIGALMVDGLGDGLMLEAPTMPAGYIRTTSFGLLQGSRMRNTKTEYVSCPSCGRTLFDLQEVTDQIRVKTGHLPGVSIAIMGCIVNGPGEMADADFGYVGGAPGKIDLYVGKEVVRRGIPDEGACDELIELIKEHGRWMDKEEEEEEEEAGLVAA